MLQKDSPIVTPPLKIKFLFYPFSSSRDVASPRCGIGITCPDIQASIALVFVDGLQGSALERRLGEGRN